MPNGLGPQYNASGMSGTLTGSMTTPTRTLPNLNPVQFPTQPGRQPSLLPQTSPGTFFPGVSSPQLQRPGQGPMTTGIPQPGAIRPELFPTLGPNIGGVEQRIPGLAIPTLGGAAPAPEQGRLGQLFSNPQFLQGLLQMGGVLGGGRYAGAAVQGVQTAFERQRQLDIERERMERERRQEAREIDIHEVRLETLTAQGEAAGVAMDLNKEQARKLRRDINKGVIQDNDDLILGALANGLENVTREGLPTLTSEGLVEVLREQNVNEKAIQHFLERPGLIDQAIEARKAELLTEEERVSSNELRGLQVANDKLQKRIFNYEITELEAKNKPLFSEPTDITKLFPGLVKAGVVKSGMTKSITMNDMPMIEALTKMEEAVQAGGPITYNQALALGQDLAKTALSAGLIESAEDLMQRSREYADMIFEARQRGKGPSPSLYSPEVFRQGEWDELQQIISQQRGVTQTPEEVAGRAAHLMEMAEVYAAPDRIGQSNEDIDNDVIRENITREESVILKTLVSRAAGRKDGPPAQRETSLIRLADGMWKEVMGTGLVPTPAERKAKSEQLIERFKKAGDIKTEAEENIVRGGLRELEKEYKEAQQESRQARAMGRMTM